MNNRQTVKLNAELVKGARIKLKHTQESLQTALKVSGTEISRKTLSSIENGNKTETYFAIKIAEELNVTLDYLMGKEEPALHYWVQIYDEGKNGELTSVNKLGTVFENSFDLLDFIYKQVFFFAPQYATDLPNIVSSYHLDKTTNTIFVSVHYGESDNTERYRIEVKLIKLSDIGLTWSTFNEFRYSWAEKSLKELLYKYSTAVNPTVSTELIEYKYQINITQLPSKSEEAEVVKSVSKYDSSEEEVIFEKYKEAWKQLASNFNYYEPIELNAFDKTSRAVQLILTAYNPSKSSNVRCHFNARNNAQFELLPNLNCPKTRGVRLSVCRIINNGQSTDIAPWPEYQMQEIGKIWSRYSNQPDNQLNSNALTQDALLDIQNYL